MNEFLRGKNWKIKKIEFVIKGELSVVFLFYFVLEEVCKGYFLVYLDFKIKGKIFFLFLNRYLLSIRLMLSFEYKL